MEIITIYPRGFGAKCYAITEDGENAIVIDPSSNRVESELMKRGWKATCVLLTHCHFDHVMGVPALQEGGAKVYCSEEEKGLVGTSAELFETTPMARVYYKIDETFRDGEEKILNGIKVKAILTSGHTRGSVCYLITAKDGGRYLFTGDTLFAGSIGRTDFETGNVGDLRLSLKKLRDLEGDYPVYPGHGEETTLEEERKNNPFLIF